MRFYGVIEAFRQGRMPDNKQIDQTLLYVRDNSPVPLNELSPQGRKLIEDSRDIIETARLMVKEKNADELRRAAHTLKSNGSTLGAEGFSELCRELEQLAKRGELDGASQLVDRIGQDYDRLQEALAALRSTAAS